MDPAREMGPAMTAKFLKADGEVIPRFTLRAPTIEERENPAHTELRGKFTET